MFTIENVFDKRVEFEKACKRANACKEEFSKLLKAKTKSEFMQVILDNFRWVYRKVSKFGLEYDFVSNFKEGFARANKGDKWGFIDVSFKEVCELEYDDVDDFDEGFARVQKWGKLYPDGREEF